MLQIPNIIHSSVPIGKSDKENVEIKKIGKPNKFTFPVKSHVELGEQLGILDFDTSAETSGKGFYYLKNELAIRGRDVRVMASKQSRNPVKYYLS